MATILPKKALVEIPTATDDEHHEAMANDPTIPQFPRGSAYGSIVVQQPQVSNFGSSTNINQSVGNTPVLTGAAPTNAASNAEVLVANTNEHWINNKWRPMMGWLYMATCAFDFMIAPILWSLLQAYMHGKVADQWQPLTLQGAGLYHLAMGAVLGIAAYGRTKEKLEAKN